MDFFESWLHISPDGGNGSSEFLMATLVVVTIISLVVAARAYLPRSFTEYLEQLGKRDGSDRFDN